jgi:hypothetical protein
VVWEAAVTAVESSYCWILAGENRVFKTNPGYGGRVIPFAALVQIMEEKYFGSETEDKK